MKKLKCIFVLSICSIFFVQCSKQEKREIKPNIIFILADDLGYGDLGVYGQQRIETPNIDKLAEDGILFTQHYSSAPVCAPARYSLLTGKHGGNAAIRGNDEWTERGPVWNYKAVAKDSTLEGQHPFPKRTQSFPKKLQEKGYTTAVFGKWGLGAPASESTPLKMGFDYFFGYNCQRQAHTYYPLHLYKDENRIHLNNDTIAPHTKLAKGANPFQSESYQSFNLNQYSPDLIFEDLIKFVDQNKNNNFFIYWATPLPHVPLQAPKRWVNYYTKKFGEEKPYLGEQDYFPHKNPRAAYAAMISYLDENIGKLVEKLKEDNIYDNTLIVFTSDNGPTTNGGVDADFFNSAGPFDDMHGRVKGYVYEGGIRVPMIVTWKNHIKTNTRTNHISAQYDVFATLADILDFENVEKTDGVSFYPTLQSKKQPQHPYLYWEFPEGEGQIAIRMGKWKIIWRNLQKDESQRRVEIYNLEKDLSEKNNLAWRYPDLVKKSIAIIRKEHKEPIFDSFKMKAIKEGYFTE